MHLFGLTGKAKRGSRRGSPEIGGRSRESCLDGRRMALFFSLHGARLLWFAFAREPERLTLAGAAPVVGR
jgi:hypothetical protein